MKLFLTIILLLPELALAQEIPQTLFLRGENLAKYKKLIQSDKLYQKAWDHLRKSTDKFIVKPAYTVTAKSLTPESGTKHDYMSFGPYWWPNPKTENGLPYIRKDGQVNPESRDDRADHQQLGKLRKELYYLSICYYYSQDEKYAARAAKLIKTWFIDPKTKMNPNLNFGQAIPGKSKGRGIGIIETRYLGNVVDTLILMNGSKYIDDETVSATKKWLAEYLDWLLHSKNGIEECDQKNNHGTWYDVQVAVLALYCNRSELAMEVFNRVRDLRLKQIQEDGSQPHELKRTRTYDYSKMNLEAFLHLARLAEHLSIDLWSTHDQKILKAALFMEKHTHSEWPYKQIREYDYTDLYITMNMVSVYKNEKIESFLEKYKSKARRDLILY